MPSSNNSDDLCPNENLNDLQNSSKNYANRLNRLEKEVSELRDEIDKIKWQRAAAETTIERAIERGAAALGGRYKLLIPDESTKTMKKQDNQESPNTDGASNESIISNDSRLSNKNQRKLVGCDATGINNVKGKKSGSEDCGQYTFG